MESLDLLLTDEYVEFSKKIVDVHGRKKAKQEEIQAIFSKAKQELGLLDVEAKGILDDWEAFKKTKESSLTTITTGKVAKNG